MTYITQIQNYLMIINAMHMKHSLLMNLVLNEIWIVGLEINSLVIIWKYFIFFGINEEEESSKCKGLKIWFKEYSEFNEKDKIFWIKIAEDIGYPKQIKINTSFGEVKDFEYDELKDL